VAIRGHELIEHTADEGLRVWAPTLEELFAEAALGLVAVMGTAHGDSVEESVTLDSSDLEALFVDWLSEILFLFEARDLYPVSARVRIDGTRLDATVEGVRFASFEQTGPAVKAVTYHELEIKKTGTGYQAVVYLDV